jgi:hypothetical protein
VSRSEGARGGGEEEERGEEEEEECRVLEAVLLSLELPLQLLVRRNKGSFGVESRDEVSASARLQTTSAHVSIRQHTSAYVSIRDEVSVAARLQTTHGEETSESAYVSIRMPAYADVCWRMLTYADASRGDE